MDKRKFITRMKNNEKLYDFISLHDISNEEILLNAGKFLYVYENKGFRLIKDSIITVVSESQVNSELKYLFSPSNEKSIIDIKNQDIWKNPSRDIVINKFISEYKNSHKGMYIFGDIGQGKTFITQLFVNILISNQKYVAYINMGQIISSLFATKDRTYIDRILYANFLFVDDIGSEQISEFYLSELFKIIDFRYQNKLPTYFTSNLSLDNLVNKFAQKDEIQAKRIVSRMNEMCDTYTLK